MIRSTSIFNGSAVGITPPPASSSFSLVVDGAAVVVEVVVAISLPLVAPSEFTLDCSVAETVNGIQKSFCDWTSRSTFGLCLGVAVVLVVVVVGVVVGVGVVVVVVVAVDGREVESLSVDSAAVLGSVVGASVLSARP